MESDFVSGEWINWLFTELVRTGWNKEKGDHDIRAIAHNVPGRVIHAYKYYLEIEVRTKAGPERRRVPYRQVYKTECVVDTKRFEHQYAR